MSSDNVHIETNAAEVYETFKTFTLKEMRAAIKRGITKASNNLRKEARSNLRKRAGKAASNTSRYGDKLTDGIRLTKIQQTKAGEFFRYLLITARRTSRSISFVLRWFEAGTSPRKTRKGYNRGQMTTKAVNFFADALRSGENTYNNTVNQELTNQIQKINNKKYSK